MFSLPLALPFSSPLSVLFHALLSPSDASVLLDLHIYILSTRIFLPQFISLLPIILFTRFSFPSTFFHYRLSLPRSRPIFCHFLFFISPRIILRF